MGASSLDILLIARIIFWYDFNEGGVCPTRNSTSKNRLALHRSNARQNY
jgi:hypothetical protein